MPKILVVDDEGPIRRLLRTALLGAGHEIAIAGGPEEAIARCASERFDLVVSDVLMPVMDGHELTRIIAGFWPQTRVILMSGFDPGCEICPYRTRCQLVPKPFSTQHMMAAITEALTRPPPELKPPEASPANR
jgi:CheY-like chemotaxis protein